MEPQKHAFGWLDVASAVHELKNPADTLTNLVYLLQQNSCLDSQARQYVTLAEKELKRLCYIIKETLARYRQPAHPTVVSVAGVLDTVLRFNEHKIAFKQIQVEKRYECEGLVTAHPEDLRQIFANLVVNAVEAVRPQGKLILHICRRSPSDGQHAGVRVVIADNGLGICADNHGKVFQQPFTTKGQKGTGLGLWISANIVYRHGGTIRFRSSTRGNRSGTVFSIFLPVAQAGHDWQTDGAALDQMQAPHEKFEGLVLRPRVNRVAAQRLRAEHRHLLAQIGVQRERFSAQKKRLNSRHLL